MTILMTRILLSPSFVAGPRERLAANLAVIAASNVGANYTLIGSLAAVMWLKLLKVGHCESDCDPEPEPHPESLSKLCPIYCRQPAAWPPV